VQPALDWAPQLVGWLLTGSGSGMENTLVTWPLRTYSVGTAAGEVSKIHYITKLRQFRALILVGKNPIMVDV